MLSAAFTKAGDYGTVQLGLDGKDLGRPIDLYEPVPAVIHTETCRWARQPSTPAPTP